MAIYVGQKSRNVKLIVGTGPKPMTGIPYVLLAGSLGTQTKIEFLGDILGCASLNGEGEERSEMIDFGSPAVIEYLSRNYRNCREFVR